MKRLLLVLEQLVARGDTLVVIEHHPDVIACADWVVELGPEAGRRGGEVVYAGEARAPLREGEDGDRQVPRRRAKAAKRRACLESDPAAEAEE